VNLAHKGEIPMTKFRSFLNDLENFAVDITFDGENAGYIMIHEAGETVFEGCYEEDRWGEGDEWDESTIIAQFVDSSSISEDLLNFLDEHPVTEGVARKWKEDLKQKFMLKGWHVK
jgi:hypothetical protein